MLLNTHHKMTWKEFGKRMREYKSFTECWPGSGKFTKRKLHKARRQFDREEIQFSLELQDRVHTRGLLGWEGETNWKGW
jgi:hypothetical protein